MHHGFHYITLLVMALLGVTNGAMAMSVVESEAFEHQYPDQRLDQLPIIVLYDNDVHGAFEGYARMAFLRTDEYAETPFVSTVSVGDFAQGGPLANYSHGLYAADMLNALGYDVVTLGNHEFDWGVEQCKAITDQIKARKVLCNFLDVEADTLMYPGYTILEYGDRRIAYVGALTPLTQHTNSPQSYVDIQGNLLYSFCMNDFYERIQRNVDAARSEGVDYVILLSHVGDADERSFSSANIVANTTGIDVILDGHSHSVVPELWLLNARGDSVLVTQTGTKFQNIGRLEISGNGTIHSQLIPTRTIQDADEGVDEIYQALCSTFDNARSFGHTDFLLEGFDPQDNYDRSYQSNLGDLSTDALRVMTGADIGWINAGGMRTNIPAGKISIKELIAVFPFENKICVVEVSGQRILDALEYSTAYYPEDSGSFPQVSGLSYHLNPDVVSPIIVDEQYRLIGIDETKSRRIFDVRIGDEPIDPQRIYTLASIDYILKFDGCSGIFSGLPMVQDVGIVDIQLLEDYIHLLGGEIPEEYKERQHRFNVR